MQMPIHKSAMLLENIRKASDKINQELLQAYQQQAKPWGIHLTSIDKHRNVETS
jgi:hypothetical protein